MHSTYASSPRPRCTTLYTSFQIQQIQLIPSQIKKQKILFYIYEWAWNILELLLCRKCGADVADSHYIFTKISPGSRNTEKQNLFGRHNITVQTLVNPFGVKFDIITMEKARCQNIGPVKCTIFQLLLHKYK